MSQVTTGGVRGRIRDFFDSIPKRTQRMAVLLCVLIGFVYVLVFAYFSVGGLRSMEEDLLDRQSRFNRLRLMQAKFLKANQQIQDAEGRLGQHKGIAPSAFLEQAANQAGVKDQLERIDERDAEVVGTLKQTRYQVTLKMAPVQSTMNFLYAVEDSGFLAVESVDIRSKFFSGEKRLTATVDLIAYASVETPK